MPPGGRTLALGWRLPVLLGAIIVALEAVSFVDSAFYPLKRGVEAVLFLLTQACASGIWGWRAWAARGSPHWPEYRLVLLGLGGAFGGFALLAVLPAMLRWRLPWPSEAAAVVLLLFPSSLSWALVRYRLLDLRHTVQRTAITVALLTAALGLGLAVAAAGRSVVGVSLAVLLAGVGVPLAQRAADCLFPDGRAAYAALVQRSGEQLSLAVEMADLVPILDEVRRGLGLAGLSLRRGDTVLAQVGVVHPGYKHGLVVRHDAEPLAELEVGEKLYHDDLLAADREALAVFCQQLGAFLTGQRLLLRLRETVDRLEETQRRLLTARRRERERLDQRLHRGPIQDAMVLRQTLVPGSSQAAALLAEDERLVVVAEACTGYEILGLVIQHQPDVLLLDLELPGQSGLEALRSLQEHVARPPRTLVLSAFQAEEYVCRARELGVAGFLSKESCDGERLREAIHRIMAGEQVLDPAIAAIVQQQTYSAKGHLLGRAYRRESPGRSALG